MYYCLIASLEQYSLSSDPSSIDFDALRAEIISELSPKDTSAVELLYSYYDILNILSRLSGLDTPHNPLGNLSEEEIAAEIKGGSSDDDEPFVTCLPASVRYALDRIQGKVIDEDQGDEPSHYSEAQIEELLLTNFYAACRASHSKYLQLWASADREIREVCAGVESSRDNLSEMSWWQPLQSVLTTEDFVEREHKMDALRWNYASELLEPGGMDGINHDFDLSAVLNYLIELNILQRWASLSKEIGRKRFDDMVRSFTSQGKIEL